MMDYSFVGALVADMLFTQELMKAPPDVASRMLKDRQERQEKQRLEAIAERRHQELCRAIRSIGYPWL